ncbi:MAG: ribosome silencing factor [Terriglobales bacterium]
MRKRSDPQVRRQLRAAVLAAGAKKAQDPVLLDLRERADFCDYFFLCHGANPAQIQAIAEAVEERLVQEFRLQPAHREGAREGEWRVLDYLDFIVHIFSTRSRRFYDLERLWRGAPTLRLPAGAEAEPAS